MTEPAKPRSRRAPKSGPTKTADAARAHGPGVPPPPNTAAPPPPPKENSPGGPSLNGPAAVALDLLSSEQRTAIETLSVNLARAAMTAQVAIAEAALKTAEKR